MKRNIVAWAALVVSSAALLSSQVTLKKAPAVQDIPAEGQKIARQLSDAFGAVADYAAPSVVQIRTSQKGGRGAILNPNTRRNRPPFNLPDGPQQDMSPEELQEMLRRFFPNFKIEPQQLQQDAPSLGMRVGTGSGFVYDDQGHILTNNHVVEGAEEIMVTFHDGGTAKAKVVGTDPGSDVAVIKVDKQGYRPLPKGKSGTLRVGEWVIAVGSPFGLDHTVTAGIISATGRQTGILGERYGSEAYEDFVQTDAAINPGNSGGPLIDLNGRVIAVNSAIATSTRSSAGVGFAIPIDMASAVADKLIKDGKINRARMGVVLEPFTPELASERGVPSGTRGVFVGQVYPGTPGERAGLKENDLIVGFDNTPALSVAGFRNHVSLSDIGKSYDLKIIRGGKPMTLKVTLEAAEKIDPRFVQGGPGRRGPSAGEKTTVKTFGLELQDLTPDLARMMGLDKEIKGVVVATVEPDSPAANAGIEAGDVITKVIKDTKVQPVGSIKEFQTLAADAKELAVHVQSADEAGRFVTLAPSDSSKDKKDAPKKDQE